VGALKANISQWRSTGISGVVVLGSTGERVHLNEQEYLDIVDAVRSEAPEGFGFVVGAGQQSTRATIEEIRRAADHGADAVLVITPSFYKPAITQDALIKHYSAVADESPVPVILYSMPPLTGIKIEPETIASLSRHQNIIGVKDSSPDIEKFKQTVELVRSSSQDDELFAVLTGNGTVLRDALNAGAWGAILAVGCVVPEICLEIFRAFEDKDHDRATALQEKLTPLAAAVTTKYGIGGLKAAMDMNGYRGGAVRAPLRMPDDLAREEIAHVLNTAQASFDGLTASTI
jgi:dihydrodipicolinate synthase/N-acetylneuraminate lyase